MLFIDGVGLGEEADHNPWFKLKTPNLRQILNGKSFTRSAVGKYNEELLVVETDACLGVPGIPQSATGQATIFTGKNAPQWVGAHMSGFPFPRLREWVKEHNFYRQFENRGWRATFANSYTKEFFTRKTTQRGWVSVTTVAIQSSKEPLRTYEDLVKGRAVFHDLTRETLRKHYPDLPEITPEEAARHLLGLALDYDLVVHEFFLSDYAGHKQIPELIQWVVETYDRFLGELVKRKSGKDSIVLVSDHGNSEDLRIKTHTKNPVPTLIVGEAGVTAFEELKREKWDLTCIVPLLSKIVEKQKG